MLEEKKQALLQLFLEHSHPTSPAPSAAPPVTLHINIQGGDGGSNGSTFINVAPVILLRQDD